MDNVDIDEADLSEVNILTVGFRISFCDERYFYSTLKRITQSPTGVAEAKSNSEALRRKHILSLPKLWGLLHLVIEFVASGLPLVGVGITCTSPYDVD